VVLFGGSLHSHPKKVQEPPANVYRSPVMSITLIDNRVMEPAYKTSLPGQLTFCIEMIDNAYFKFSRDQRVITAGLLFQGTNFITAEAAGLFKHTGFHTYTYILDMKIEGRIFQERINLDITLEPASPLTEEKKEVPRISLFANKGIADPMKRNADSPGELPVIFADAPLSDPSDPTHQTPGSLFPYPARISPLTLAATAYNLFKKNAWERRERKRRRLAWKKNEIKGIFLATDPKGNPINVSLKITIRGEN
jgi:hypothetical protein